MNDRACLNGPGSFVVWLLPAVLVISCPAQVVWAQEPAITGRVVDAETGVAIANAQVRLISPTGAARAVSSTDADGAFRLALPDAERNALLVSASGYRSRRVEGIGADARTAGDIALSSDAFVLNPIVVTASRRGEKTLEAPASVHNIDAVAIAKRPATTPVEHLRNVPGVDIITSGLARHAVAVRGFNNAINRNLFVLTDYRWTALPSLRMNTFNTIPIVNDDIEGIDVVLGPGSALYGPNTANGVMHIITRSPLEHQGTSISLTSGERSVLQGTLRHAGVIGDRAGYKISGLYFRGDEWRYTDPVAQANRQAAIDAGADPDTLLIGRRDFDAERFSLDGRLDFRMGDEGSVVVSAGLAELVNSIEQVETDHGQVKGWTHSYVQARLRRSRFFAQAYAAFSDAGDTYRLRSGSRLVDDSWILGAQLQHGDDVGERQSFTYGADLIRTVPRTRGTIHGRFEDDDVVTEVGGYLQSETRLAARLELVGAARMDYHDVLDDVVMSPRAAVVFEAAEGHSLRLTFNRGFQMPPATNLFVDIVSSPTLGGLPFGIRVVGNAHGHAFRRDCMSALVSAGLCMRSPFTPDAMGGPLQLLPLDATLLWDAAVGVVTAQDPAAGSQLAAMNPPDASQVGTAMRMLNLRTGRFDPVSAVNDVPKLGASITHTLELGYKGLLADRVFIGVDVYYSRVKDFIGTALLATPSVFLEPAALRDHLVSESARVGLGLDDATIDSLRDRLANIPVAAITPEDPSSRQSPADLMLTSQNFGEVEYWGSDLAATVMASDRLSVTGSYSWVSENLFKNVSGLGDLPLNAPRTKGSLAVEYDDRRVGLAVEVRGRHVGGFPFAAGVFQGPVDSYTLFDANVTYALPFIPGAAITLQALNALDHEHQEVPGAPQIGRLLLLTLRAEF